MVGCNVKAVLVPVSCVVCRAVGSSLSEDRSLVRDAPEDDVVQQGDLLSQLHRRQRLKALCPRTLRLEPTHTHTHTHTHVLR